MSRLLALIVVPLAFVLATGLSAGPQLVMVEEPGCIWCERWNAEISHKYPKTTEGKLAPLRRVNLHEEMPSDLSFASKLRFTPTFVLVVDGAEVSRLEGYPGEDFFWGLLGGMLRNAGFDLPVNG